MNKKLTNDKESFVSNWKETRKKGRGNYILRHSILPNTIAMSIIYPIGDAILELIFSSKITINRHFIIRYVETIIITSILVGISTGLSKWKENEKRYFNTPDDI